jgi:hypothetical protein
MSAGGGETGRVDFNAEYADGAEKAKPPVCGLRRIAAERLDEE